MTCLRRFFISLLVMVFPKISFNGLIVLVKLKSFSRLLDDRFFAFFGRRKVVFNFLMFGGVRSHIDWREERNILYKGVETSP